MLRIVVASGADAVTHRRVAEAAGLPLASTTYWFSSKDEMLCAALERAAARDLDRLSRRVQKVMSAKVVSVAAAASVFDPFDADLRSSRGALIGAYALWLEAARRPALRNVSEQWSQAYNDAAARLLAACGSPRPASDAGLLIAALDGLIMQDLALGRSSRLRPALTRLIDALIRAA